MAKNFYNGIKGMKVKEVPEHVKPVLSMNYLKSITHQQHAKEHGGH